MILILYFPAVLRVLLLCTYAALRGRLRYVLLSAQVHRGVRFRTRALEIEANCNGTLECCSFLGLDQLIFVA
ncbi:uncharacterized protein LY79DRAFT_562152 [Colletotrichum navitas]|uniref:Uncharacterized protein n=1 Tax=Colletotrichum navitas TaxID=681940 RepID=A0AAD8PTF9_9PEZI|nr:uncharacterized protein LY79DRAFT_562152 [Colletotrichum navitas]KAK1580226.1 hypothetical protein LY79DRAFT_562152 [Colletotrichum navitas]